MGSSPAAENAESEDIGGRGEEGRGLYFALWGNVYVKANRSAFAAGKGLYGPTSVFSVL